MLRGIAICRPVCRRRSRVAASCLPGWQKKFEPFPVEVERRLPALPDGYRRGVIDGHGVIFNTRTNVIIDVAVLF